MKDCKFCDKKGLLILPLRYAAVAGDGADQALPAMPATLGEHVTDLPLQHAAYAPRLMRSGYLYVLIKRASATYWEAYAINDDAFLAKFPVNDPPTQPLVFSCDRTTCGLDASMISVDKVEFVQKVYLLFSPSLMTPAKLNEYKTNADAKVAKGEMQVFDPKGWVAGHNNQKHSLKPELLDNNVVEFMLYQQDKGALSSELGKIMSRQMFPAISDAYAGVPAPKPGQPKPGRLGMLQFKMKNVKAAAFVVHDHIGITQELNDSRNSALEGVQNYLMATDQYGASNQHRLQVSEAILEVRDALKHGVVHDMQQWLDSRTPYLKQMEMNDVALAKMLRKTGHIKDAEQVEKQIEEYKVQQRKTYADMMAKAHVQAEERWRDKYESRLDMAEMALFRTTLKSHTRKAFKAVEARSHDHLAWFESDRLVNAFEVFDPQDLPGGYNFAVHSALCTLGIAGCEVAADKLDAWISAPSVARKNLYLRGIYYNQTELIAAANKANDEITAAVGTVEFASDIKASHMIKITKDLVSGFKKVDSAFDEWARNQVKEDYAQKWSKRGLEIVLYHKASDATRAIFRQGLGGTFDKVLTARLSGLLYARLGRITTDLAFDQLMLSMPKPALQKNARARTVRRAEQRRAAAAMEQAKKVADEVDDSLETLIHDAQAKQQVKVKLTLNQIRGNTNLPTNNYHQARIGVLLGCLEMIAFGEKLTHFEPDSKGFLEVAGSVFAISGVVLDTYYAAAKSIREIKPYSAIDPIKKGADIVRGGFKLYAGALSGAAGLCGAILDVMKCVKEKDPVLKAIYGMRAAAGLVSVGLTLLSAFSYAEPLLMNVAGRYATGSTQRKALELAAEYALRYAARVRLLVWVARMNWIGLALTLAEVGYLLLKDDDLQNWCEICVFRKVKRYTNFLGTPKVQEHYINMNGELAELNKAIQAVGIGG